MSISSLASRLLMLLVLCFSSIELIFAEVSITTSSGDYATVNLENSTSRTWYLGGWRFDANNATFNYVEGNGYLTCINDTLASGFLHTTQATSVAPQWATIIKSGSAASFRSTWGGGQGLTFGDPYVLLKTGAYGVPEKPTDEAPITLDQLDSLMATANFYNENHRYKDSLGANGGKYSGGLLDTWFGQTQVQMVIDGQHFSGISFGPSTTGGPIYWMTIAMGQEYFNIDMQWMIGFGVKETWAGVNGAPYNGNNGEGAYGCWEVESYTGLDRALGYPMYYPEYASKLASALDVTNSGIDPFKWAKDYTDDEPTNTTPINSSYVVGAYMLSITNMHGLYGLLSYCDDLCWKESLDGAKDPYLGLECIGPLYNLGMTNVAGICAPINKDNYAATKQMSDASSLFPAGNSGYAPAIIGMVQNLVNASTAALSDNTIPIWDYSVPWDDVERFFLGDGGSVAKQGNSGLLKHFELDDTQKRQAIMTIVQSAFDKLKGQSPSTSGTDNISFRYDWIALLRTVKQYFNVDGFYSKPNGGGLAAAISLHSSIGGCSTEERDTTYPFSSVNSQTYGNDFVVVVNATDNKNIKEVTWTIESNWNSWNPGVYTSGTAGNQNFTLTVPKQQITDVYGVNTGKLWYMVTDESGNSIVKDVIIEGSPSPSLDSVIITDKDGDGLGDLVTVFLKESAANDADKLNTISNLNFSWPTQTGLVPVLSSSLTTVSNGITFNDPNPDAGAGIGKVTFDYPSKKNYSAEILDRVGPAINKGSASYDPNMTPDTLFITFSEAVKNLSKDGGEFFYFKMVGGSETSVSNSAAVDLGNNQWAIVFNTGEIANYDSVRIIPTSKIVDVIGNSAADNNQWVAIAKGVIIEGFVVDHAAYFDLHDQNGVDSIKDGRIDEIRFYLDSLPDTQCFDNILIKLDASNLLLPKWREFSWTTAIIRTEYGFKLGVKQDISYRDVVTKITDEDIITFASNLQSGDVTLVKSILNSSSIMDSIAPVLIFAKFMPFIVTDDNIGSTNEYDSLNIRYSEEVKAMGSGNEQDSCFGYMHGQSPNEHYSMILQLRSAPGDGVFKAFDVIDKTDYPNTDDNDSIWIFNANRRIMEIVDLAGNIQSDKTQPIPLLVDDYVYNFTFEIVPNPFSMSYLQRTGEKQQKINNFENTDCMWKFLEVTKKGIVVLGKALSKLQNGEEADFAITVLDAVGNIVKQELDPVTVVKNLYYPFVWDMTNENGKFVGPGIYLVVIRPRTGKGKTIQQKVIVTK